MKPKKQPEVPAAAPVESAPATPGQTQHTVMTPSVPAGRDRFTDARLLKQGARPGDGRYTAGRDRVTEGRFRRDGARPS